MSFVRPKKHLGQHFLKDKNIAVKIVKAMERCDSDTILEIGPGTGILTSQLINNPDIDFYAIEVDIESFDYLKSAYPSIADKLIYKDFLKISLTDFFNQPITIIGNFHYNI